MEVPNYVVLSHIYHRLKDLTGTLIVTHQHPTTMLIGLTPHNNASLQSEIRVKC